MLELGDGITKIPLTWVHTLMCLALLSFMSWSAFKTDSHRSRILHKLSLHYALFEQPNTMSCMFQVDFDFSRFRAGYPTVFLGVCGQHCCRCSQRHLNRMAVFRRFKKFEFVDAELSLRYWASHDNLFQLVLVPLKSEDYKSAWVAEHELIAQWQTPLNYPRAMTLLKNTALGGRISSKCRASLYGNFGFLTLTLGQAWRGLQK